MSNSTKRMLVATSLGALAMLLLWGAAGVGSRAQATAGSTFTFPHGLYALTQAMWFASGGVIAVALRLGQPRTDPGAGVGHLVAAAVFPLLVMAIFWAWISGLPFSVASFRWIISMAVQTAAAIIAGTLLTAAALRRFLS